MKRIRKEQEVDSKRPNVPFSRIFILKNNIQKIASFIPEKFSLSLVCKDWMSALHHTNNIFWNNAYMNTFGIWQHNEDMVPKTFWTKQNFQERLTRSKQQRALKQAIYKCYFPLHVFSYQPTTISHFCHTVRQWNVPVTQVLERDILKHALKEITQESEFSSEIIEIAKQTLGVFPIFIEHVSQHYIDRDVRLFTLSFVWYTLQPQEAPIIIRARYEEEIDITRGSITYVDNQVETVLLECEWTEYEDTIIKIKEDDLTYLKDILLGQDAEEDGLNMIYVIIRLINSLCTLDAVEVVEQALHEYYGDPGMFE
jgi:hypothetical protein